MRICYIASPGVHTNRWMKYFADSGHEVHLITSSELSGDNISNVQLHWLKRFGPNIRVVNYLINSLPLVIQFKRLIRNIKPDIIHAHQIMDITLLGAVSGFHPFVVTPWGSDVLIAPQKSIISRWIVKYALKSADLITCDGEQVKGPLIKLGAHPQKIRVIYFGVDTKKFAPGQVDNTLGAKLGVSDSPTVISLRSLEPIYDIKSLIAAIPLVLRDVPTTKFVIAGDGTQGDQLKNLAQSLGVSDSVRFVGLISHDELPKYLASANIYVSTSLSDAGLAVSTAEAMACGLPVVITDFGDNRKWVEDGVNGFLIPLSNPEALAERVVYLLRDKNARLDFGRVNRGIIQEEYDYYRQMKRMEDIYKGLIDT